MSGHSKWSTIKHKKGKADAAKGKIFTKIGREIMVAVKMGGADPDMNPRLRDAISKAKANNMPNDNVNRVIKKAAGENDDVNYEEIIYEGYGPGGVAVIVEAMTDNKNRTASNVRFYFDKNGGSLGATGCVNWMFDRKGSIAIEKSDAIKEDDKYIFGCDICQQVCPWNRFSKAHHEPRFNTTPFINELEKHGITSDSTNSFRQRFKNTALERTGEKNLIRNIGHIDHKVHK